MPIRSLGQLALVFALIFGLQLAAVLLPWQPLDASWQWRLGNTLINAAPLPLLALALLQIAVAIDPCDPVLKQRQRLFRRLAVAAALGFVLLVPLQASAGLRQQSSVNTAQRSRIVGAERRLAALRAATAQATSSSMLNAELLKLQGPVLGPADLTNPLPLLKAQVNAVFDQAQIQINRDRSSLPPVSVVTALPELLRNGLSCLLLACAFAGFARRSGSEMSLLEEGLAAFGQVQLRRRASAREVSDGGYIRQLSADREP